MAETRFTPGPWVVGEYDEYLGYDAMTSGIQVGPVTLDGNQYGERRCTYDGGASWDRERMEADAHLIAAAPDLYDMLASIENDDGRIPGWLWNRIQSTLAKARGETNDG